MANNGKMWKANPRPITNSDPTGWRDGDYGLNTVECAYPEGTNKGIRSGAPKEAGMNTPQRNTTYGEKS